MNNAVLNIINLIALVVIPIVSVWVAQYLQDRAARCRDKMAIFQCLMTYRAAGWANPDAVNALNTIDIVFADDNEVRACWASLPSKYKPNFSAQEVNTAQC